MTPHSITSRQMRRAGWLVVACALLVQVWAWAWMPGMAGAQAVGDRFVFALCVADTSVAPSADGDADWTPPISPGLSDHSCQLCPWVGGLGFPPLAATPYALLAVDGAAFQGRLVTSWSNTDNHTRQQPRAPPAV